MERIKVYNISKTFQISGGENKSVLQRAISVFSDKEQKQTLHVLTDVSFTVSAGEILGIVGRNGCGKSTLLRILAGIMEKDAGVVETDGKIVAAIQLDTGMKSRLTMEENILLLSSFLHFTHKEKQEKLDSIIEYSGLRDFVHTKWYQFSSGMKQRVVFAVSVHAEPDIFLLDEVFAVGDEQFRQKGFKKFEELREKGATIVIAGHNLPLLEDYCDKVIWIDAGKIRMEGKSSDVIQAYKDYEK